MYGTIKSVIKSKSFDLNDITIKIKKLYISNDITEGQCDELLKLAQENAADTNSFDFMATLMELDKRVRALEGGAPAGKEYPEFVVGKWYYAGDKITFKGKHYECTAPKDTACVWNPEAYPNYWREIK